MKLKREKRRETYSLIVNLKSCTVYACTNLIQLPPKVVFRGKLNSSCLSKKPNLKTSSKERRESLNKGLKNHSIS